MSRGRRESCVLRLPSGQTQKVGDSHRCFGPLQGGVSCFHDGPPPGQMAHQVPVGSLGEIRWDHRSRRVSPDLHHCRPGRRGRAQIKANYFHVALKGTVRSWLMNLPVCSVGSWGELNSLSPTSSNCLHARAPKATFSRSTRKRVRHYDNTSNISAKYPIHLGSHEQMLGGQA